MKPTKEIIKNINFSNVKIKSEMWLELIKLVQEVTIPNNIAKCYETKRIENFKVAGKLVEGNFEGRFYNDSDVYKILEGVGYSLSQVKNPKLEASADEIISFIEAAQEKSGYIFTMYTILDKERFTNMDKHEMYCGGHLIEAGIAYYLGTGKKSLLNVGIKFANHLMDLFGPNKRDWVPGHQEIELALVKLGELLNEEKYIIFAKWLLDERGKGFGTKGPHEKDDWNKEYYQDTVTVDKLEKVEGHAVRAMYMYTAMADVSKHLSTNYLGALEKVWDNVCNKNMYITGGIGSSCENEGFTFDYDLPNDTAYCETCASVGMVLFNQRMFSFLGNSKYLDVVEKEMFNGIISGLGADGKSFFYDNPLESKGDKFRKEWFNTSCCPTQLTRFIPSVGNYLYSKTQNRLYINTFIANELNDEDIFAEIESDFPNSGNLKISGEVKQNITELYIRIPEWANSYSYEFIKEAEFLKIQDGFLVVKIKNKFELKINFVMSIDFIKSHDNVKYNSGKVAIQYGPSIYCLEELDTPDYENFSIEATDIFKLNNNYDVFKNKIIIEVTNKNSGTLKGNLIPYYLWNNRGQKKMKVFIPYNDKNLLYKK